MPGIQEINTAVTRILRADETLGSLCTVYKGAKRPVRARTPALTVETRRLERGEGEGMWMCDIVITAYADMKSNGIPDDGLLDAILARACALLADAELELAAAKAHPLIEGESGGAEWQPAHDREMYQERVFGLVFVSFR
jgi:hypothetical protein